MQWLQTQFRRLIGPKLGRCSYCMRVSARAAVAGWGVVALLALGWPNALAMRLALAAALALTALVLAHLVAYTWWAVPRVRLCLAARQCQDAPDLERRRFMGAALRMGAAVGVSLLGFGRTVLATGGSTGGQGSSKCAGAQVEFGVITLSFSSESAAREAFEAEARRVCGGRCGELDDCPKPIPPPPGPTSITTGSPCIYRFSPPLNPKCPQDLSGSFHCEGKVVCICSCRDLIT